MLEPSPKPKSATSSWGWRYSRPVCSASRWRRWKNRGRIARMLTVFQTTVVCQFKIESHHLLHETTSNNSPPPHPPAPPPAPEIPAHPAALKCGKSSRTWGVRNEGLFWGMLGGCLALFWGMFEVYSGFGGELFWLGYGPIKVGI